MSDRLLVKIIAEQVRGCRATNGAECKVEIVEGVENSTQYPGVRRKDRGGGHQGQSNVQCSMSNGKTVRRRKIGM